MTAEHTGAEGPRYHPPEAPHPNAVVLCGDLVRHNGEWKFRAIGQGYASGLAGIAKDYGVNVG